MGLIPESATGQVQEHRFQVRLLDIHRTKPDAYFIRLRNHRREDFFSFCGDHCDGAIRGVGMNHPGQAAHGFSERPGIFAFCGNQDESRGGASSKVVESSTRQR